MATDRTNISNAGSGTLQLTKQVVPVDGLPSTLGLSMSPQPAYPLIAGAVFYARGRGRNDLTEHVPPKDVRFVRGPKISGRQGTLDIWFTAPDNGTARTLCYLTDAPASVGNVLAIRIDTTNRPLITLTETGGSTAATGALTGTANFTNTETVTIDGKIYTFQTVLTEVNGNVFIGVDLTTSLLNLLRAINLGAGGGSLYANATTLHTTVTATASDATTLTVAAKAGGPGGNAITTTEGAADASWGGVILAGGSVGSTIVAETLPSGPAIPTGRTTHARLAWDSLNPVSGARHASFSVNGEPIDAGEWSTNPTSPWVHFQPTHLVLAEGFDTDSDIPDVDTIQTVQASNIITL